LYANDELVDTKNVENDWTVLFTKTILLPKWETTKLELKINTDNSLFSWNSELKLKVEIESWTNNLLIVTSNWIQLDNDFVEWSFPIKSDLVIIHPTSYIYLYKDNSIIDTQIIYPDKNKNEGYWFVYS